MFNHINLTKNETDFFIKNLGQQETKVHLIKRKFIGKELAGLGGIVFRYGFLPSFFLVVSQKYRNMGIGQEISARVFGEWGKKPLFLTVPVGNKPAIHIYEKFGFAKISQWRQIRGQKMQLMFRL